MSINILVIGDENAAAVAKYLSKIGRCDDVEFAIGCLYMKGADLEAHSHAFQTNAPTYTFEYFGAGCLRSDENDSFPPEKALEWETWDYVSLQQSIAKGGLEDSYLPFVAGIAEKIRAFCPGASLALNETWAFHKSCTDPDFELYGNDQERMAQMIRSACLAAAERAEIKIIIPVGEAWQRARKVFESDCLTGEDSAYGNRMGEFLTGAVWYEILTATDITKNSYRLPFVPAENVTALKGVAHEVAEKYRLKK